MDSRPTGLDLINIHLHVLYQKAKTQASEFNSKINLEPNLESNQISKTKSNQCLSNNDMLDIKSHMLELEIEKVSCLVSLSL